jgi:hypothetical protein
MVPQAGAEMKRPAAARAAPSTTPVPGRPVEVRGRVVGPDGRPVPGATVRSAWADTAEGDPTIPDVTSAPDGRFVARIPRPHRSAGMVNGADAMPWLAASAPGFGPGWVARVLRPDAPGELTIRLVVDGPPIVGRIIDLEGRPVAGARVRVDRRWYVKDERSWPVEADDLPGWLRRIQDQGDGLGQLPMPIAAATTDRDGRFRLTGIGRERIAELMVSAPTIATTLIYAMCHDGPEVRVADREALEPRTIVLHAPRFQYAAGPTQPIEGVIRDQDNGRPIAGVRVCGAVYKERSLVRDPGVEATSDDRGHYRLLGLNKASAYRLFLWPKPGLPYPNATLRVAAGAPALEPIRFDMALKRGILVRGRVTDRATGRPVPGFISAYTFRGNPRAREFPGYEDSNPPHVYLEDDGRYEVVALTGRGLITCQSDYRRYRSGVGAEAIPGAQDYFDTLPRQVFRDQFQALAVVDLDPKAESATLDLQVDPGRSLAIQVVDPEGRPLAGTMAMGVAPRFFREEEQDSPTIEVRGLERSKPRRVIVYHEARRLVGLVDLKGDETAPLTVRLQPWGTLAGRIVDEQGRPLGGLEVCNLFAYSLDRNPPPSRGTLPSLPIGRDGRFRVERLIPSLMYGGGASQGVMYRGDLFRAVTLAPGEVKDLGDLRIMPRKRGE